MENSIQPKQRCPSAQLVVSGQVQVKLGPVLLSAMPSWQSFVYLDRFESLSEEDRFCLDARFQLEIKSDLYFAVEGLI